MDFLEVVARELAAGTSELRVRRMVVVEAFVRFLVLQRGDAAAKHHRNLGDSLGRLEVWEHVLKYLGLLRGDLLLWRLHSMLAWPRKDSSNLLPRAEDYSLRKLTRLLPCLYLAAEVPHIMVSDLPNAIRLILFVHHEVLPLRARVLLEVQRLLGLHQLLVLNDELGFLVD